MDGRLPTAALGRGGVLLRLAPVLRGHRGRVALTVIAALANQLAGIGTAAAAALLTGAAATGASVDELTPLIVVVIGLALTKALMAWLESWVAHDMAFRVMRDLRVQLFDGLVRLAPAWLSGRRTGDVARAALADIEALEWFYAHTVAQVIVTVLIPVFAVALLAAIDPVLAAVMLPFVAGIALVPLFLLRRGDREGQAIRRRMGDLQADTTDAVQGLRELLVLGAQERWRRRIDRATRVLAEVQLSNASRVGLENGISEGLVAGAMLAVLLAGGWLVRDGAIPADRYPVAVVIAGVALAPVLVVTGGIRNLGVLRATASRVTAIVDTPARVVDRPTVWARVRPIDEHRPVPIRFDGVRFGYRADRPVLRGLTLDVPAGTTLALVGESGAGKSTCANLLLRFWDPDEGRILLDDRDLRDIPLADLRRLVALVPQDPYLFTGSIGDNLRLARPEAPVARIRTAAEAALVSEFTDTLPEGLETPVGERGARVSGGQRQRIALAQGLLRDARVLVLDEATAGVDAQGEATLLDALRSAGRDRTTIIIAHRLSTILASDRVAVVGDGRVVEEGAPGALIASGGAFRALVERQIDGLIG
jgi:thiol reductant ABC exporter CydC subunit